MNRTTARLALAVAGAGALTGLGAGVANAAAPYDNPPQGESTDSYQGETDQGGGGAVYVLGGLPGVPLEDPTLGLFDALSPVYGVLDSLG